MKTFRSNGLNVWLNDVELNDDVFISLSIGGGFGSEWMGCKEDIIKIGPASAKLYANYIKRTLKEIGLHGLETNVSMHSTSLIWQTKDDTYLEDVQKVLNSIFLGLNDKSLFEDEKEQTIKRFKHCYKDLSFRGSMKMLEFAHQNTLYRFEHLIKGLQESTIEQMESFNKYVIHPENMFLYIHGTIDENSLQHLEVPEFHHNYAQQLFKAGRVHFSEDELYKVTSTKGSWHCGCIRFERHRPVQDLTAEHLILSLIGEILFQGKVIVKVDHGDASLTYFRQPLRTYKDEIMKLVTEQNFEKAREKLINNFDTQVRYRPLNFVEWVGQSYMQQIHVYKWVNLLKTITADEFSDWMIKSNYVIREGYLKYEKEGSVYGR